MHLADNSWKWNHQMQWYGLICDWFFFLLTRSVRTVFIMKVEKWWKFSKITAKRLKIEETLKACSEDKRKGNQTKIKDSLMALQWIIQKVHYEEKHTDTKRKEHREPKKRPCTKNQLVSITRLVILSITLPFYFIYHLFTYQNKEQMHNG